MISLVLNVLIVCWNCYKLKFLQMNSIDDGFRYYMPISCSSFQGNVVSVQCTVGKQNAVGGVGVCGGV